MEKNKILNLLENADWKDIVLRLTHHAIWKAYQYTWKSGNPHQLPGGKTPEDVACAAIEKVWNGTRNWDPDKYPDLLLHLTWVVDSDIEHLFSSKEHRKNIRMQEPEQCDPPDSNEIMPNSSSSLIAMAEVSTPEEQLVAREERYLEEELKNQLENIVKGDEDLEMLLLCFEEGIEKPEMIAAQTGWAISKVYNLKRKLLRKAAKINRNFRQKEQLDRREYDE